MARDENQTGNWDRFWSNSGKSEKLSWSKKRLIELLSPLLHGRKSVLDAGCGSGFFSKFFSEMNLEVYSVDNSDKALELCRKTAGDKVRLIKLDLITTPLHSSLNTRFDLIFTDGLLEHFSPPLQQKILKNFRDSLSSNGVIVTVVPNKFSLWQIIRPFFMPGIIETPFTLRQLKLLHTKAGFSIIKAGGLNVFPVAFSPEKLFGKQLGMLLYTIAKRDCP
ncbi:MAG: hypothetical protein ACD_39C00875G0002 [uncultured bacterium]|nr:MAG: hypothetical protein ACD_39C00875G0002 [uncultured bacterium]